MPFIALIYLSLLAAIFLCAIKSKGMPPIAVLVATFVLVWADVVLTAQILSLFSALNLTLLFVLLSISIAFIAAVGLHRLAPHQPLYVQPFATFLPPRLIGLASLFIGATAALLVFGDLILAYSLLPANPDSIVYRFPRAYWYLAQGSLGHFSNTGDPRAIYYPFNGTLAYLPLIYFQLEPRFFVLPSLLSWFVCGLTTYAFARNLGGSRFASAATAWIICFTPNVFLQSLSTNDDIIAAVPLLIGLFFLHRWYLDRQILNLVLGIMAVGLSAGTKLHVVFYLPLLLAIAMAILFHWRSAVEDLATLARHHIVAVLGAVGIAAVFAFSFLAYNYISAGQLTAWQFNAQVLNQPFNWRVALQTNALYLAQTVLTPIADLHIAFNVTQRAHHYESFNRIFAPLFTWVSNSKEFVSVSYRFSGVASPSAKVFNQQTIFIGFTWAVWLVAAARVFSARRTPNVIWGRFHIASWPIWFVAFASSMRYIEGVTVYLAYATIISAPALVFAFAPIVGARLNLLRWLAIAFVAVTHFFFALNILFTSSPNNLFVVWKAPKLPISRGFEIDDDVLAEIAKAKHGIVERAWTWGKPTWAFMAYYPNIRHYSASIPTVIEPFRGVPKRTEPYEVSSSRFVAMPSPDDKRLNIYSFLQQPRWGDVAIRIPDKPSPGLTWIGDLRFSLGPEWVFAAGNAVASRHPGHDKFIVLNFHEVSDFGHDPQPFINVGGVFYGLGPTDDLEFRYETHVGGVLTDQTDWNPSPLAKLKIDDLSSDNGVLTVFVRNDATGSVTKKDVSLRSKEAAAL